MRTQFVISFILTIGLYFQVQSQNSGYFESINGKAVYGLATATSGENYGGWFKAKGTEGQGVYGIASNSSGINYGGFFESTSGEGRGVYGISTKDSGTNYGGYFQAEGSTGRAVFGLAAGTTQENYGGWFKAKGIEGRGVYGEASDVNGINYGGYFLSKSIAGRAVFGLAEYVQGGVNYGGWFKSKGTSGRGVYGVASESTGTSKNYGGYFEAEGGMGVGVHASGKAFDFYAEGSPGMDYGSGSSVRWKTNIVEIDRPLEKINTLRGVYYDWDEEHGGQHDIGMIAEEVGKTLPEIVVYEANNIDAIGMDYSKLTPLLVEVAKAMRKEYQQKFDRQQDEIDDIKKRLGELESLLQSDNTTDFGKE